MMPMIHVRYRHVFLPELIPNSCTGLINYFLYCRHAHTKSGCQGVVQITSSQKAGKLNFLQVDQTELMIDVVVLDVEGKIRAFD